MAENIRPAGTSSMPLPTTVEYNHKFLVTELFKHDLETILGDIAYADAVKFFNVISNHDSIFTTAVLSEFIHSLSMLPYKVVSPLMRVLDDEKNFKKYFKQIEEK